MIFSQFSTLLFFCKLLFFSLSPSYQIIFNFYFIPLVATLPNWLWPQTNACSWFGCNFCKDWPRPFCSAHGAESRAPVLHLPRSAREPSVCWHVVARPFHRPWVWGHSSSRGLERNPGAPRYSRCTPLAPPLSPTLPPVAAQQLGYLSGVFLGRHKGELCRSLFVSHIVIWYM